MIKNIFSTIVLLLLAGVFFLMIIDYYPRYELSPLADQYVQGSVKDLNTPNVVTSIVVTYRGLDTLGEVTVLFLATAGVGFLLKKRISDKERKRPASEILITTSQFLAPLIILLGVYIFIHGHLTPGGGFQGGVLIASAFLLMMLSDIDLKINHLILQIVESFSGAFYVVIGLLGLIMLGGFLDPRFLLPGQYGQLFSSGAIPVIYSLIGLKVGSELTGILEYMRGGEE